jgi:hypothetical protein
MLFVVAQPTNRLAKNFQRAAFFALGSAAHMVLGSHPARKKISHGGVAKFH